MTNNYYVLTRTANKQILKILSYLRENPKHTASVSKLVIDFLYAYGFKKRAVLSLLQVYVDADQLIIDGDDIKATFPKNNEVQNGDNNKPI